MTYLINGFAAHNPDLGWILERDTQFVYSTTITRPDLAIPGFDGVIEMDGVEEVPGVTLVWTVRESALPGLRNVLRSNPLTLTKAGRSASVSLRSLEPEQIGIGPDPAYRVTAELILTGVWLRGPETTKTFMLTPGTQTLDVLAPSDGKVHDGVIVISGPLAPGLMLQDVAGMSWVRYTAAVPAGARLRYDMASRSAWLVLIGDGFTGGSEMSQYLQTGPSVYYLRLCPVIDPKNPAIARPKLRVTANGTSAATLLTVRARTAHVL